MQPPDLDDESSYIQKIEMNDEYAYAAVIDNAGRLWIKGGVLFQSEPEDVHQPLGLDELTLVEGLPNLREIHRWTLPRYPLIRALYMLDETGQVWMMGEDNFGIFDPLEADYYDMFVGQSHAILQPIFSPRLIPELNRVRHLSVSPGGIYAVGEEGGMLWRSSMDAPSDWDYFGYNDSLKIDRELDRKMTRWIFERAEEGKAALLPRSELPEGMERQISTWPRAEEVEFELRYEEGLTLRDYWSNGRMQFAIDQQGRLLGEKAYLGSESMWLWLPNDTETEAVAFTPEGLVVTASGDIVDYGLVKCYQPDYSMFSAELVEKMREGFGDPNPLARRAWEMMRARMAQMTSAMKANSQLLRFVDAEIIELSLSHSFGFIYEDALVEAYRFHYRLKPHPEDLEMVMPAGALILDEEGWLGYAHPRSWMIAIRSGDELSYLSHVWPFLGGGVLDATLGALYNLAPHRDSLPDGREASPIEVTRAYAMTEEEAIASFADDRGQVDPAKVAQMLLTRFITDLYEIPERRSFYFIEAKDKYSEFSYLTLQLYPANDAPAEYALQDWEKDGRSWVVEPTLRYRFVGSIEGIGVEEEGSETWYDQLYAGPRIGFLLQGRDGHYILRSRYAPDGGRLSPYLDEYGAIAE